MKNVSFYGGIAAEVGNSRGIVEDGLTKLRKSNYVKPDRVLNSSPHAARDP
jgi:hypothetical protein